MNAHSLGERSERSVMRSQRTLVQDDSQTEPLPANNRSLINSCCGLSMRQFGQPGRRDGTFSIIVVESVGGMALEDDLTIELRTEAWRIARHQQRLFRRVHSLVEGAAARRFSDGENAKGITVGVGNVNVVGDHVAIVGEGKPGE